ncbi:MAG TPA: hypothetical protein VK890_02305, partial [Bacteroidia bacterium]|nr:hypothetical protein [Bacteroidia bacterium]
MKNNSILYGVGVALSFVLLIGCATQTKSSYVLNPDMSGKCVFEEKIGLDAAQLSGFMSLKKGADNPFAGGDDTAVQTPQQVAMAFASKILASKGIETWSDVHFGLIGRDTVYFKGTGYFKNLANVNLAMLDTLLTVSTNEHGETTLELREPPKKASDDSATRAARGIANSILPKGGTTNAMIHYYMAAFLRGLDI